LNEKKMNDDDDEAH